MGHYTSCTLEFKLKTDTPEIVVNSLTWLLEEAYRIAAKNDGYDVVLSPKYKGFTPDEDPFFKMAYFYSIGQNVNDYFGEDEKCVIGGKDNKWIIRTNCKNIDQLIEAFISWLMPYIEGNDGDFIGTFCPEDYNYNDEEKPTVRVGEGVVYRKWNNIY